VQELKNFHFAWNWTPTNTTRALLMPRHAVNCQQLDLELARTIRNGVRKKWELRTYDKK